MLFNKIFNKRTSGIEWKLYLLITITIVLFNHQESYSQVSISPSRVYFEGKPGEMVSQTVIVSNSGDEVYEFRIGLKDWKRDSSGIKLYEEPGKLLHSNANQIKLNESIIVVKPGESKKVLVYMSIPESKTYPDTISSNSMLFFTQLVKDEQKTNVSGIGIKVGYEYGIQLFYTPYFAKPGDLDFTEFDYIADNSKIKKSRGNIRIKYKNTGQIHKTCILQVELTNKKTGEEIKLKSRDLAIMPIDFQIIHLDLPADLIEGEYLVVAMLSSDSYQFKTSLKVAKKSIYVK